jgi:excinuclease ABC subunit A
MSKIKIVGAKEHNLKDITLEIPRDKLVVFTGISGSGKSTLAYDTLFAEAQRRYLESLSSYARQFLGQFRKPDVEFIEGLSPAISIDQKSVSHNPRSTVGTVTEIYDYLRLLYARLGTPHCPKCNRIVSGLSQEEVLDNILELPEGEEVDIYSPLVRAQKGHHGVLLDDLFQKGFKTVRIDDELYELEDKIDIDRYKVHNIDVLVDSLKIESKNFQRVIEAVEAAMKLSKGEVIVGDKFFNQHLACPHCGLSFPEIEPHTFSFNSPYGACEECHGIGRKKVLDESLIIPDKLKTVAEGGILPWSYKRNNYYGALLDALATHYRFQVNNRIKDIPEEIVNKMLKGEEKPVLLKLVTGYGIGRETFKIKFPGFMPWLLKRYNRTDSDSVRRDVERYMRDKKCLACKGRRLNPQALAVLSNGIFYC